MKLKTSAYHIPVFIYRFGIVALTLPLQTILLKNAKGLLSAYIYILNLLILSALVIYACVYCKYIGCTITPHHLEITKGFQAQSRTTIRFKKTHTIRITQGPLQKKLGVCRLSIVSANAQPMLYVGLSSLQKTFPKKPNSIIYRNSKGSALLLSVGFYNAFTGALTLIPLLKKIASLSKTYEYSAGFLTSDFTAYTIKEVSSVLFGLSLLIIFLWCTGVAVTFLRYANLTLSHSDSFLKTQQGILVKHTTYTNPEKISAVILRQNLLMILLNRYTGEFRTSCDKKENKLTFLCGAKHKDAERTVKQFGFKSAANKQILPHPKSLWGYTYLPVSILSAVFSAEIFADIYFDGIYKNRLGLFVILWLVAWFLFRVCVWSRCFIASGKNIVCIGCYFGLTYCKAYIPKEKIRCIKISQTPFQQRKNTCNLRIYVMGRSKKSYFIKHIDKQKAAELKQELCG